MASMTVLAALRIRLDSRKSGRPFRGIICDDISQFESDHLSHAVGSLALLAAMTGIGCPTHRYLAISGYSSAGSDGRIAISCGIEEIPGCHRPPWRFGAI